MHKIGVFLPLALAFGIIACQSSSDKNAHRADTLQTTGQNTNAPNGMIIFRQNCVICHGADGQLGLNGAKDLSKSERPVAERIQIITQGKNLMAPFQTILSPEEIAAVAAYTLTFKK